MRKIFFIAIVAVLAAVGLNSCKTNEKNYRKAYEKAVANNDRGVTDFEGTIYNQYRSQVTEIPVTCDDGSVVNTRQVRVKVTQDGGGINEWLKKYSVVVGEFKQLFNANSLRNRFVEAGYPGAFLVENAEPYYYIIVASTNDPKEAAQIADKLRANSPIPIKEGFPYILQR